MSGKERASTKPAALSRVAIFLAKGPALCEPASDGRSAALTGPGGRRLGARLETIEALAARGWIERVGSALALTASGRRSIGLDATAQGGVEPARPNPKPSYNSAESPLTLLASRKTREGAAFLTQREFDAGEKLRTDYTFGQFMPGLGVDWSMTGAGKRGGGGPGGLADLTDAALSARQRVDEAIDAVGPELSGVLIDICCFLKGLERVEMERGWPVRSAKIVLKTALGALARHYFPKREGAGARASVLHWGSADYRPEILG